jgi:hypothetical protein
VPRALHGRAVAATGPTGSVVPRPGRAGSAGRHSPNENCGDRNPGCTSDHTARSRTFKDEADNSQIKRSQGRGQPHRDCEDQTSLKEQVVLVTGSSGGIGAVVVDAVTAAGAVTLGADRAPRKNQALAAFFPLDVTSEQQCAAVIQEITKQHSRIDSPLHAAGVLGTTPDPMETTTEEFESIMRINSSRTYSMVRATARSCRVRHRRLDHHHLLGGGQRGTQLPVLSRKQTSLCSTSCGRSPRYSVPNGISVTPSHPARSTLPCGHSLVGATHLPVTEHRQLKNGW